MSERSYSRKPPRNCSKLIYVLSEGSRREPEYFKHFGKDHSRFKIINIDRTSQENNSPSGLLAKGEVFKKELKKNPDTEIRKSDEFWLVIDVDAWPQLGSFLQSAKSKGWNVAISNPCFEVWLYFHVHSELPIGNLSEWKGEDWKRHLDESVPGGFNSAKHYDRYPLAVATAREKYSEIDGIPAIGSTSVYRIFEAFSP